MTSIFSDRYLTPCLMSLMTKAFSMPKKTRQRMRKPNCPEKEGQYAHSANGKGGREERTR
jgi:hypothetical protein